MEEDGAHVQHVFFHFNESDEELTVWFGSGTARLI
jgi:hypothetical protein